ncbi:MAG TPA: heavy-metal-associated domain-containing protein [Bryobacteraceae bacterium]|nr:heavy-metal-associated domain-containing protein [Bryobacteraceae bacterium]
MIVRRRFIQGIACGLGAAEAVTGAAKTKTVTYRIEGFTCVTCAVGLDTLLKDQKGIVRSKSSWPDRTATIEYNPELVHEEQIKGFIQELGFRAK